jgi:hypothetical protein
VSHVLRVAAFEIGDPVADLVLMEADDLAIQGGNGTRRSLSTHRGRISSQLERLNPQPRKLVREREALQKHYEPVRKARFKRKIVVWQ